MTVEEILQALQDIIDAAGAEPLAPEALDRYEALEAQLANLRRGEEATARMAARNQVRPGIVPVQIDPANSAEYRALDIYLRTGDPSSIRNAQSEGVPSEGGYLVPNTFRDKMVECMHSFGGLAPFAEEFSTSTGAPVTWPTVSDAPNGVPNQAVITPEGQQQASAGADLVFGEAQLGAYTYTTTGANNEPLRISRELLQDAAFPVQDLVARKFGERVARKQAVDFATGSGVGEPKGILTGTANVELVTSNDIANAANGYAKLLEIEDALDEAYLANARWGMNRATWSRVRSIVDADGRPLIQASATAGIGGGIDRTLLGFPVTVDYGFPSAADDVNFMVFGDIREAYVIRRVKDIEVIVDPYSRAKYRQVEMSGFARADATVQNRCAYVIVKGKDGA